MKGKAKKQALGDDPLSWIVKDSIKFTSKQKGEAESESAKQASEKNVPAENSSDELIEASSGKPQSNAKKTIKTKTTLSAAEATGPKKSTQKASSVVTPASNVYKFDAVMTVSQSVGLKEQFGDLLENNASDITLDGSAVENIDSAALQLLLTFLIELKARNCRVFWSHISPQLLGRSRALGLSTVFGIDEADS